MNITKFIFWLPVLHHFGAMALLPPVTSIATEKDYFFEVVTGGDHHVPVSLATKYIWIGPLDFLAEMEPKTNNAFHSREIFTTKTQIGLPTGCPYFERSIVPSLDTLTIIYPFHSFP